jgi:type II secretory pathway pseudopilin PulG
LSAASWSLRAFSLLELTFAIAIMVVLAAVAMPRFGAAQGRWRADAAARRVAADLALAQSRARTTCSSVTLSFISGTNQYQIIGMSDPDRPNATYTVDLASDPYGAAVTSVVFGGGGTNTPGGNLSQGAAADPSGTQSVNSVSFNAWGIASSAGTISIRAGAVTRTISVDAGGAVGVQ